MFQLKMPLVHMLAPHEDYYVLLSIYLRSRQTLNIHICHSLGQWTLPLDYLTCIILRQKPITSRINQSLIPMIFSDINMIYSLFLIASHSIVVHMLERRTSACMYVMTIFVHYQLLSRRALNWTHFLYFDISYHIA